MEGIYSNIDEILIEEGLLSEKDIKIAKEEAGKRGISVYDALKDSGLVSEEKMTLLMADRLNLPLVELNSYVIDKDVIELVPEKTARKYLVIPLFKISDSLTLAMANPKDIEAIDTIKLKSKCSIIDPVLSSPGEINKAIEKYYSASGNVEDVIESISDKQDIEEEQEIEEKDILELVEEAPIVKLVNLIISNAVEEGASDIHIEPDEKILRVRYRIDGVLHEVNKSPKKLQNAVISRIKVLAGMDIAKRYVPQDGKISLKIKNKELDLRVSTFPTVDGENAVIRILDKSSVLKGLEKLGFLNKDFEIFSNLITHPNGIILVTGPTGSGKTTTLYSALATINSLDKNTNRQINMVENLLNLSRIERGAVTGIREKVSINYLVKEAINSIYYSAFQKSVNIKFHPVDEDIQLWCVPDQIERVFINIINNALKYSYENSKIEVFIFDEGDFVQCAVQDYGPGIKKENIDKIFEKFLQVQSSEKSKSVSGGIGLGLAICREIVHAHKGSIFVESEEGKGSRFIFKLPKDLRIIQRN